MRSSPLRSALTCLLTAALWAGLALPSAAPALAGADDFEFGQKLAQNRWFDQARHVFEGMVNDDKSSATTKDLARYGLANLGYEQARSVAARADTPLAEVVRLAEAAATQIAEFATKNPTHPMANQAKLQSGQVRIWLVEWAKELAESPEAMEARKTTQAEVLGVARKAVEDVVSYFDGLKAQGGAVAVMADYYWTMCQYYRALVYEACSAQQVEALAQAEKALDAYCTNHDGERLASWAHDVLGQVIQARARCAQNDTDKEQLFNRALAEFQIAIDTEWEDGETLLIIANGYQHYGLACLEAKRINTQNYLRRGVDALTAMLPRVPNVVTTVAGLRAVIVLGDLYRALGNVREAVETLKLASDRAIAVNRQELAKEANRKIKETLARGTAGAGALDVAVLRKVADALFSEESFAEAIGAYRSVIMAAPHTTTAFVDHIWPSWERISGCYQSQDDPLSAALALEPIYEAWKDGRIPAKDDENDPLMRRAGNTRLKQSSLYDQVAARTGAAVFKELYKRSKETFAEDFPKHPEARAGLWNTAIGHLREARDLKKQKDAGWKAKAETARGEFGQLAADAKNERQDAAFVQMVVADRMLSDDPAGGDPAGGKAAAERGLETVARAVAYWESADGVKRMKDFPHLEAARREALLSLRGHEGALLKVLARWPDVLTRMAAFRQSQPPAAEAADAQALIVEAHLALNQMDEADAALKTLIAESPKHSDINVLISKVAATFDNQFRTLSEEWKKLDEEQRGNALDRGAGLESKLRVATEQFNKDTLALVELRNQLAINETTLKGHREGKLDTLRKEQLKDLEEKTIPEAKKSIATLEANVARLTAEMEKLSARLDEIAKAMDAIEVKQYAPLKEALKRYQTGLDVQIANDPGSLNPGYVYQIAMRWWFATRNPQSQPDDWTAAQKGFEFYLGMDKVKALPETDADKRSAVAKLGRIYAYLGAQQSDTGARGELLGKAVLLLERSIASRPENAELVVGLLEGRYAATTWQNDAERDRPTIRIVLPKVESVDALKAVIAKLGTNEAKLALAVVGEAPKQAQYRKGIADWKTAMQRATADEWEHLWRGLKSGGLDAATYAMLGNTLAEFRVALAAAYAEQGTDADTRKGEAILATLLRGPIALVEYEQEWWEAATLAIRLWLAAADRLTPKGSSVPAAASDLRKRTRQFIQGKVGAASVPASLRPTWVKLIDQLNKGLDLEKSPRLEVRLDRPVPAQPR